MEGSRGNWIQMKMDGADQVAKTLRGLSDAMGKKMLDRAVRKEVKRWATAAASQAPQSDRWHFVGRREKGLLVQPTNLKRAIRVKKLRIAAWGKETDAHFGIWIPAIAFYWRFIELGTVKYAKHPYLRPAFDELAPDSLRNVTISAEKSITAYLKKNAKSVGVSKRTARMVLR